MAKQPPTGIFFLILVIVVGSGFYLYFQQNPLTSPSPTTPPNNNWGIQNTTTTTLTPDPLPLEFYSPNLLRGECHDQLEIDVDGEPATVRYEILTVEQSHSGADANYYRFQCRITLIQTNLIYLMSGDAEILTLDTQLTPMGENQFSFLSIYQLRSGLFIEADQQQNCFRLQNGPTMTFAAIGAPTIISSNTIEGNVLTNTLHAEFLVTLVLTQTR